MKSVIPVRADPWNALRTIEVFEAGYGLTGGIKSATAGICAEW